MITFTIISLGTNLSLDNPILGDSEQLDIKTKYEISMSRVIHSTITTNSHSKFLMTFDNMGDAKKVLLESFLTLAKGLATRYTDYLGAVRTGMFLGEVFEFTRVGYNLFEPRWSITLEYEVIN